MPSTPADAKGLLKTAIRDEDPVVFLEHKLLYFTKGPVPAASSDEPGLIPFGRAAIAREGTHVTVLASQVMLHHALRAAQELAPEGIDIEVIDPRTLVPFDIETLLGSVRKTTRLVICHEAVERGGWAGEIVAQVVELAFDHLDAPIVRVCARNLPVPYSKPLEDAVIPGLDEVVAGVRRVLDGSDLSSWRGFS
jgi:pyruvate dehydrogenase E1 component beta subunit